MRKVLQYLMNHKLKMFIVSFVLSLPILLYSIKLIQCYTNIEAEIIGASFTFIAILYAIFQNQINEWFSKENFEYDLEFVKRENDLKYDILFVVQNPPKGKVLFGTLNIVSFSIDNYEELTEDRNLIFQNIIVVENSKPTKLGDVSFRIGLVEGVTYYIDFRLFSNLFTTGRIVKEKIDKIKVEFYLVYEYENNGKQYAKTIKVERKLKYLFE